MQALITSTDKIPKPHQAQLMGTPTKRGRKGGRELHCNLAAITCFYRTPGLPAEHGPTATAKLLLVRQQQPQPPLRPRDVRRIASDERFFPILCIYHTICPIYIYMYSIYIYHTIPFPVLPLPSGIAPPRIAFSLVCQTLQLHVPCAMYTPVYPRNCASSKQVQPCVFAVNQYS